MKTYYTGEIKRDIDGNLWIDDNKFDWCPMDECQLTEHLCSLLKSIINIWKANDIAGDMFIEVKVDDGTRKEASND